METGGVSVETVCKGGRAGDGEGSRTRVVTSGQGFGVMAWSGE